MLHVQKIPFSRPDSSFQKKSRRRPRNLVQDFPRIVYRVIGTGRGKAGELAASVRGDKGENSVQRRATAE
jgi:hypothetical protein